MSTIGAMGKIYAKAVVSGPRTLASVPSMWRDATVAALEAMAADGTITAEKLAELTAQ